MVLLDMLESVCSTRYVIGSMDIRNVISQTKMRNFRAYLVKEDTPGRRKMIYI